MRIAVIGIGGVGGFFGGKLAQAGEEVYFMARGAHLEAMRQSGLMVHSVDGDFLIQPAHAESDAAEIGAVDIVLVAVKAWQVPAAAQAIRPLMGENTIVIPLQNGVEAAGQLSEGVGAQHVSGGFCRIFSMIEAPGVIRHKGVEPIIAFNWRDGHADKRLTALQDIYLRMGVTAQMPADIEAQLWEKFTFIASFGGVGAVSGATVGEQLAVPQTAHLLRTAVDEIANVGRACGVALDAGVEQRTWDYILSLPAQTTASMQRDILEGKPSELDYQNGSVVRLGDAHGIDTPVHDFLYASLLPRERRARGE